MTSHLRKLALTAYKIPDISYIYKSAYFSVMKLNIEYLPNNRSDAEGLNILRQICDSLQSAESRMLHLSLQRPTTIIPGSVPYSKK